MTEKVSPSNRFMMGVFLVGVAILSFIVLKLILWLDGVK